MHGIDCFLNRNPELTSEFERFQFAGEPAFVAVRGRDAFMNPIQSGGANLIAQLRRFCSAELAEADVAAEIRDRGDGIYEIDCALKTACDFEVRISALDFGPRKAKAKRS